MKEYLKIVNDVIENGVEKTNRTGMKCISTFAQVFRHNMKDGFPLLTTKRMPLKVILVELEGFIQGVTSKKWFQDRGCNIWNEWSNPLSTNTDDLGPIYGYQWRRFNQCWDENDDGTLEQYDQLQKIVNQLKQDPNDRRMICSAWNPLHLEIQALPPCHFCFGLNHMSGILNLFWIQRSCDLMLGVPFNIASYATLLLLFCKEASLRPGELVGFLADCHIYKNQMDGVDKQLTRLPRKLPELTILGDPFDIFKWTHKDVELKNYTPYKKIDFGPVAV